MKGIKMPTAKAVYQFTPKVTFFSPEMKSWYIKGEPYTVREGYDRLHALVQGKWNKAGLV